MLSKSLNELKPTFILGLLLLCCFSGISQEQINWLNWEEAVAKSKVEKKKIFVDIYTKWCGWCKKMDKSTFQNPAVISYLNKNFYAVKFDAEQREDILLKDKVYQFTGNKKGYNTLAAELTKGKMSYPTITFLDENFNLLQPIPGFRSPKELEMILSYFAGNHFKTTPWKTYARYYEPRQKGNIEPNSPKYTQPAKFNNN